MKYDLEFFDQEAGLVECAENPSVLNCLPGMNHDVLTGT
jgi:hypothetical protein